MRRLKLIAIIIILNLVAINPHFVKAELFVDIFAGGSFSKDDNLTVSFTDKKITSQANFDQSLSIGYRLGYNLNNFPFLGFAMEISYFTQDTDDADLRVIPVSALLMLRYSLSNWKNYPDGDILPYLAIGPSMFFSRINYEVANTNIPGLIEIPSLSGKYYDKTTKIGLDARAGIKKMFNNNTSLFFEYRYTRVNPEFEDNIFNNKVKTEIELNTHHLLIGFSYHF